MHFFGALEMNSNPIISKKDNKFLSIFQLEHVYDEILKVEQHINLLNIIGSS